MTDLDVVLRWGPVALALAGASLGMLTIAAHVSLARLWVAARNRRVRRALTPVVSLGDAPPEGAVCLQGALVLPARHALEDRDEPAAEDERPVIDTPTRRVRLDGPLRVTAGTVDIVRPAPSLRRIMRGAQVRVRGRVRLMPSQEGESYRGESAAWSLVPDGDHIEVAAMTTKRIRGHRWGRSIALAAVAAVAPAGLATWAGQRAFARVGAPGIELLRVEGEVARWRRVWSASDQERLALAAMSPLLRAKVRNQRALESELRTAFPPLTAAEAERLAGVLRENGDCYHEAALALRTGYLSRAETLASSCADVAARALQRDARCASDPGDADACMLASLGSAEAVERWSSVLASRAARRDATGGGGVRADDPGPVGRGAEPVECAIVTTVRDPGSGAAPLSAAAWDDLLAHPDLRCRLLGATRATRRDAAALGALLDAATPPTRRALVSHARAYVSMVGTDQGRITGPACAERPAPPELDPAFLEANPGVALALLRAAMQSPCPWLADHVYLVAAQGFSRFLSEAGGDVGDALCGGGRCSGAAEDRGWMWTADGVRMSRTLLRFWDTALRRADRRYTPRRRQDVGAFEARLLSGAPSLVAPLLDASLARDGNWPGDFTWASVVRAMGSLRSPAAWPHREFAERHGLHAHQFDREPVWASPVATSQERAPRFAALVDYWRTGTWAPARDAPALYRSARMRRVVDAAAAWNTEDVLRVIGPPDDEGVEMLAAVAPRLTGRRPSAEYWLRAALGFRPTLSRSGAAQVHHLARVVSAARRLRLNALAAEVDALRAATLDALLSRDPWVTAVLDDARAEVARAAH